MTRPQDLDGKYRIGPILEQGDRAMIVAATHLALREPVIVKVLNADERDPRFAAKLRRAATQSAALRSPHVVRYLDVGHLTDQRPYVVMERLSGQTLAQRLASKGPLSVQQVVDVLLQTCEALACAHVRGIIHRDLRPSNIFCTQQPDDRIVIKVLNFGTGRTVDVKGVQEDQGMTVAALAIDAPDYKAPEQIVPRSKIDTRTDTWALGVIAYEMLVGVCPFSAPSAEETARRLLAADVRPSPQIPSDLWTVIRGCIAMRRDDRWNSVGIIADALEQAAGPDTAGYATRIRQILKTPVAMDPVVDVDDEAGSSASEWIGLPTTTVVSPPPFDQLDDDSVEPANAAEGGMGLPRIDNGETQPRSLPWVRISQLGDALKIRRDVPETGRVRRVLLLGAALAVLLVAIALVVQRATAPKVTTKLPPPFMEPAPPLVVVAPTGSTPATLPSVSPALSVLTQAGGPQGPLRPAGSRSVSTGQTGASSSVRPAPSRSPHTASSRKGGDGDDPWGWER